MLLFFFSMQNYITGKRFSLKLNISQFLRLLMIYVADQEPKTIFSFFPFYTWLCYRIGELKGGSLDFSHLTDLKECIYHLNLYVKKKKKNTNHE